MGGARRFHARRQQVFEFEHGRAGGRHDVGHHAVLVGGFGRREDVVEQHAVEVVLRHPDDLVAGAMQEYGLESADLALHVDLHASTDAHTGAVRPQPRS